MADRKFPLTLTIRAVDKATAKIREVNKKIAQATEPVRKLNNGFRALAKEAGFPKLAKGFSAVGSAAVGVGRETLALGTKFAAMAGVAAFALHRVVRGAVNAGDDLATIADRVGLGVDAFASLQYAAAQADVEQEEFNKAMDQFNKRLGEAKAGTGSLLEFLKKVSPALASQVKGAKTTEEAIGLMADAMAKVKDPAKRAALANAAFGRSGLQMGVFLSQGSKAIQSQQLRFMELTGSQEEFARGAGALDNAMRDTEYAFLGLRSAAAGALFPALTELSRALTNVLAGNRGKLREWAQQTGAAISAWVKSGGLERLVSGLKSFATTVGKVVDLLGGLKGVAVVIAGVMTGKLMVAIASLVPMFAQLGISMAPLLVAAAPILAVAAAIGGVAAAVYQLYKHWDDLKLIFREFWQEHGEWITKLMNFTPMGMTFKAAKWAGEKLFGADEVKPAPALGADRARAPGPAKSEARVSVDFSNMPKGARVTPDRNNTAPLDLAVGYSMVPVQ